jgi:phospholipid transport system substrate-binding protein
MMSRRALLLALLTSPLAQALPAQAESSPSAPIQALNTGLLIVMRLGRARPFEERMRILTPVVQATFNLPLILQNSVSPAKWTTIALAQQTELLNVFTQFTVSSYVSNFDEYNGEKFDISPELRHVGKDVVVQTRIVPTAGDTTRLDYVMREFAGLWQVVDILLNGSISRVAVTRSDFRSMLPGNDATSLIHSLRDKVAGFAAGNAT